jgi:hypothetical protein
MAVVVHALASGVCSHQPSVRSAWNFWADLF